MGILKGSCMHARLCWWCFCLQPIPRIPHTYIHTYIHTVTVTLSLAAGPYNIPPMVNIPGLPERVVRINQRADFSGM